MKTTERLPIEAAFPAVVESMQWADGTLEVVVRMYVRGRSVRSFSLGPERLPVIVIHSAHQRATVSPWKPLLSWFRDIVCGGTAGRYEATARASIRELGFAMENLPDDPEAVTALLTSALSELRDTGTGRILVNVPKLEQSLRFLLSGSDSTAVLQMVDSMLAAIEASMGTVGIASPASSLDTGMTSPQAVPRDPIPVALDDHAPAALDARHLKTAIDVRDRLLRQEVWMTSAEVCHCVQDHVPISNPSEYAERLRQEGGLFGVRLGTEYRHPAFQFDPTTGALNPAMRRLIALLPTSDANWAAAFWLFQPNYWLRGQRPADVFATEPEGVITAAEKDFRQDHVGA